MSQDRSGLVDLHIESVSGFPKLSVLGIEDVAALLFMGCKTRTYRSGDRGGIVSMCSVEITTVEDSYSIVVRR